MRLEQVLPALREGKRIRRKYWIVGSHLWLSNMTGDVMYTEGQNTIYHSFTGAALDADDWEIAPEHREPNKYKTTVFLYDDGQSTLNSTLYEPHPLRSDPRVVKIQVIEWEVPDNG